MTKIATFLLALLISTSAILAQTPVMTMTTAQAVGSTVSFDLQASVNNTPVQVDFGDGTLVVKTVGTSITNINGALVSTQTVKIYGIGITYLDCSYNQLTALDISNNTALTDLGCYKNQLTTLDVSNNKALETLYCLFNQLTTLDVSNNKVLQSLYCSSNQLTALDISKNMVLIDLECSNNQLTTLDVSNNTALITLDCYYNQLTTLDVSKNMLLIDLECSDNKLTTLDVSKNMVLHEFRCFSNQLTNLDVSNNKALYHLNCSSNQLTTLDVINNTALRDLNCSSNQLITLDVSNNTALTDLGCGLNQLTTLDVSNNTALTFLDCSANQLTTLDVSKNTSLNSLHCPYNQLTFATLPLKQASWTTYTYSPQSAISIAKATPTNTALDLSAQNTINGKTTVYSWKTKVGTTLTAGTDYTITGGITTFLKPQTDSVYCTMTNATFPAFTGSNVLKTTCTLVTLGTASTQIKVSNVEVYTAIKTIYITVPSDAHALVYDINGRIVTEKSLKAGNNQINLLNGGIYTVKLVAGKSAVTKKVWVE